MDPTALFSFSSGLYVVSAYDGKKAAGCLVNTGMQLTSEPYQISVTINKENFTTSIVESAGHFTLAVLDESADMPFIGRFGFRTSKDFDKFDGIASEKSATGDIYPTEHVCAFVSCRVVKIIDVGTHMEFIGEMIDAAHLSQVPPMTYAYYHGTLKGKTPEKASSYIKEA